MDMQGTKLIPNPKYVLIIFCRPEMELSNTGRFIAALASAIFNAKRTASQNIINNIVDCFGIC